TAPSRASEPLARSALCAGLWRGFRRPFRYVFAHPLAEAGGPQRAVNSSHYREVSRRSRPGVLKPCEAAFVLFGPPLVAPKATPTGAPTHANSPRPDHPGPVYPFSHNATFAAR